MEVKQWPQLNFEAQKKPEDPVDKIWLEFLLHQKMLECEVGVTKCIVMVQVSTVFPFFQPFLLLNVRYKFLSLAAHSA